MKGFALILVSGFVMLVPFNQSLGGGPDSLCAKAEYSKDGIGILVSLTPDRHIIEKWTELQMPNISTSTSYKRGEHVIPLIVYSFASQDHTPYPALLYDITILKPDGTAYAHFEKLLAFDGGSLKPQVLYLLKQPIDIGLEQNDPLGVYKVYLVIYAGKRQLTTFSNLSFKVTK